MASLVLTRAITARARIKRDQLAVPEETGVPLGNWYATFLRMPERNAFVYMSSRTQLSFLMLEGERLTPEKLYISLVRGVCMVLELTGFPERTRERMMHDYRSVSFSKASDLSMLGVLTNTALDYEAFISEDGGLNRCSLDQLIVEMNCRPAKKLGFNTPLEETAKALGVQPDFAFQGNPLRGSPELGS